MTKKFIRLVVSNIMTLCVLGSAQVFASSANMDTIFNTGLPIGFDQQVTAIKIQNNGKIIVGGNFSSYKGISTNRIARLNADGTIDFTAYFGGQFNNGVNTITVQEDEKILVGGIFTTYSGTTSNRIVRLNADGTKDNTFDIGGGFNNTVYTIAIQNDGKILVGGDFTSYNGTSANRIIRLNTDGTKDDSFIIGGGFNVAPSTIILQDDGKILVGGQFTAYSGTTAYFIVRLNTDGTKDDSFNFGGGFQNRVNAIAIQSDGKIIMGGMFTSYSGTAANRIIRLNTDGTKDSSFNFGGGFNNTVYTIKIQDDGDILVGGDFTTYSGASSNRIIRLNSDGTKDTSFSIGSGFNIGVSDIGIQSGGKLLIGGNFTNYNGVTTKYIIRLNTNGTIDRSLDLGQGFDDKILTTTTQNDGKILAGGRFTSYGGEASNSIVRLHPDGSRDSSFIIGSGFNNDVYSIAIQSDGKILVGGQFTSFNGTTGNRIIRLNADGSIDTSFTIGIGFNNNVTNIIPQSGGKLLIGGTFTNYSGTIQNRIIRLNSDGSIDTGFRTGNGFATNGVYILVEQSDGKILAGGQFTAYSGTSSNRIARLNADGSIDTGFIVGSGFNGDVWDMGVQSDGKIVVGGQFTAYNGIRANYIARLNTDGTIDTGFNSGSGFNFNIYSIAIHADDKIIVGGQFTSFNGVSANRIIRLNSDGSRDDSLYIGVGYNGIVEDIKIQNDGKVLVGGRFTTYNLMPAGYLTSLYGDAPVVKLPNTSDTGTINTAFIDKGYTETGGVLSGSVPISLELTDGKIPTTLEITNQNIGLSLSGDTQFKQSDTVTNYTGIISVPIIKDINSINDQNVIAAINVGSTSENIVLTGGSSTISIPVPTQTIGQTIQVSSSQNNGVTWYPELITQVVDKNGTPTVEFNTDKLADFALTQTTDTIAPTASVIYSTTGATNQDVIATLTGSSEVITGLNTPSYTFTGNGTFTFTFQDLAGNTGATTANVNRIDKTAPIISILGEASLNIVQGSSYIDSGATALDIIDGDLTANIVTSGTVNTSVTGTYIISYNVVDAAGNPATEATRYVTVVQKGAPTASVVYSTTGTTNQNVIATITGFSEAITGLNATGYTFTGNGTFTFTFQDLYGNTGSITATVTWINKTVDHSSGGSSSSNNGGSSIVNQPPSTSGSGTHQTGNITNSPYPSEQNNAYIWAFDNNITTMDTIQKANIEGPLIRKDMAKMVSNFAINVLHKIPSTGTICKYPDIDLVTEEMKYYILLSCKLGLMGFESNGITLKKTFDPEMIVDRAQFGTILSRLIRAGKYNGGYPYYVKHLNALKDAGIMTKITTPFQQEIRGYVMLMMMRATQ